MDLRIAAFILLAWCPFSHLLAENAPACDARAMADPKSLQDLSNAVEALIQGYLSNAQDAVLHGLERGLGGTRAKARSSTAASRQGGGIPTGSKRQRTNSTKRSPELLEKMMEELYQSIVDAPGESMTALAKELDYSALELQVPVAKLKKNKRVRTAGARQHTRHFAVPA